MPTFRLNVMILVETLVELVSFFLKRRKYINYYIILDKLVIAHVNLHFFGGFF